MRGKKLAGTVLSEKNRRTGGNMMRHTEFRWSFAIQDATYDDGQ